MRRSISKIRHINQTNILLENRYLIEQGEDNTVKLLSNLPKSQKDEISANLIKQIENHPKGDEIKKELDLHLPMENQPILNKILQKAKFNLMQNNFKFKIGGVEIEVPLPGNLAKSILSGVNQNDKGGPITPPSTIGIKVPINWGRK